MKKTDYYKLLGLKFMAEEHNKFLEKIQSAIAEILNEKIEHPGDGWSGELTYVDDKSVDEVLSIMNIEVDNE